MTTVSALLAGFSLAAAMGLMTAGTRPVLYEWSSSLFVAASAAFVFALQFTFSGLQYAAPPAERLAWLPRDESGNPRPEFLVGAERVQKKDFELQKRYFRRTDASYNLGLVLFLVGLALLFLPVSGQSVPQVVGLLTVGAALCLEILWIGARIFPRMRPHWLAPGYRSLAGEFEDLPPKGPPAPH